MLKKLLIATIAAIALSSSRPALAQSIYAEPFSTPYYGFTCSGSFGLNGHNVRVVPQIWAYDTNLQAWWFYWDDSGYQANFAAASTTADLSHIVGYVGCFVEYWYDNDIKYGDGFIGWYNWPPV